MKNIKLYKLVAAGNDFILFNAKSKRNTSFYRKLAKICCRRNYAWGADGLLVVEKEKGLKMRIFNPDGSEAEMCGNGARCAALWIYKYLKKSKKISFSTPAGIITASLTKAKKQKVGSFCFSYAVAAKIGMPQPQDLKLDIALRGFSLPLRLSFVNTGVPHAVVISDNLKNINVENLGRLIRYHNYFSPAGTNVDFVEFKNENLIEVRTYERGVEKETLACGTGVVASAIIHKFRNSSLRKSNRVSVLTRSGEVLKVYFNYQNEKISKVELEGNAYLIGEMRG